MMSNCELRVQPPRVSAVGVRVRKFQTGTLRRACACGLLLAVPLVIAWFATQVCEAGPPPALQGTLLSVPGSGPTLRARGKDIPLAGKNTFLFHTLQDKRLLNREVRLEGTARPDGTFEVSRLYTIHHGRLYRVRYFCDVCNIEALEPGDCVCCQRPTDLQEIPVGEPDTDIQDIIVTH